jgi:hypothetical protein
VCEGRENCVFSAYYPWQVAWLRSAVSTAGEVLEPLAWALETMWGGPEAVYHYLLPSAIEGYERPEAKLVRTAIEVGGRGVGGGTGLGWWVRAATAGCV